MNDNDQKFTIGFVLGEAIVQAVAVDKETFTVLKAYSMPINKVVHSSLKDKNELHIRMPMACSRVISKMTQMTFTNIEGQTRKIVI